MKKYILIYSKSHLDLAQLIFRLLLLSILETLKILYGQSILLTIFNNIFYFFYLLTTSIDTKIKIEETQNQFNSKRNSFFLVILSINIIEFISWYINKAPFNTQALAALEIKNIIIQLSNFLPYFINILISCIIITFFPYYQFIIQIPKIYIPFKFVYYSLLFIFYLTILTDFHDINNKSLFDPIDDVYFTIIKKILLDKYDEKPTILSAINKTKSLILVQLESFPYEIARDPFVCPNLSNFLQRYEVIAPIQSQPYTSWSLTGMSVTQTGIPQIFPNPQFFTYAHSTDYEFIVGIKGIPNLLSSYNYTLQYAVVGKNKLMGFDPWVFAHNYKQIYKARNDRDLFDFFTDKHLIEMDKNIRESSFEKKYLTFIVNINTHSPYDKPRWCRLNFTGMKKYQKCFHCCDSAVGRFIDKFLELKMYEHTVLAVFPDHRPFQIDFNELFVLFPGMEKVDSKYKINGEITYYDFAPTILDLIGFKKYQPENPFGRKIYNNSDESDRKYCLNGDCIIKHNKPDQNDLTLLYKFIHHEYGKKIKAKYNISDPFTCTINGKRYISSVPCINNSK